jgi:hypothetical protein
MMGELRVSLEKIKAETARLLTAMPTGSWLIYMYCDGGTDGNGANGECSAGGFGVVVIRKGLDWSPTYTPTHVNDCFFGPVITDSIDPYWLGADRGTNNTGELNGIATALTGCREMLIVDSGCRAILDCSIIAYCSLARRFALSPAGRSCAYK